MGKQFRFISSLELKLLDLSKIEEFHIEYLRTFRSIGLENNDIEKCINLKRLSTDGATEELFTNLSKLNNFEELHIYNGWFREFSSNIPVLKKLKVLTLSNSKYYHVYDFPKFILNCPNLEILTINNCSFSEIPEEISELDKLVILDLSNNRITKLPETIFELPNLQSLNISNNWLVKLDLIRLIENSSYKIPHINSEKATLQDIAHLSFYKEDLNKILPYLKNMYDLTYLSMSNMFNFDLKKLINHLPSVAFLRLRDNSISKIPYEINRLKYLEFLDLKWNVNVNPRQLKSAITDIYYDYTILLNKDYLIPELQNDYINQRIKNQQTDFCKKKKELNDCVGYEFDEKLKNLNTSDNGSRELISYSIPIEYQEHYDNLKEVVKSRKSVALKLISNFRHTDNIINDTDNQMNKCSFKYGLNNENIILYTGNPICSGSIEKSIKERFVYMQSLDRDGILQLHRDYMNAYGRMDGSNRFDNSLVEILRKRGQILMNFIPINEHFTFFELIVYFDNNKKKP